MKEQIICSGFGGQGIMILGKIIAYSAMNKGLNVTWMPSYGAEVRGGTAHCMVVISDQEIASPIIADCTAAVIMNKPSLDKFLKAISPNKIYPKLKSLLLLNSSLDDRDIAKKGIDVMKIAMTEIALALGNVRAANMVALGAYTKKRGIFQRAAVLKGIKIAFANNKDIIDLNIKAFDKGASLV
jgi:2-oxoglutarate ferredoxin oxidoreductase subunit gamma